MSKTKKQIIIYTFLSVGLLLLTTGFFMYKAISALPIPDVNIKITFQEGMNAREIIERLAENGFLIDEEKFIEQEGYLFPDTYKFHPQASSDQVLKQMTENFLAKVGEIDLEDLILASIVQSEEYNIREMPKVAGVFYNRLDKGIRLQADSTVNYITGKNHRQVALDDTKIDNPYNTYLYKGLPPGPISNPGLKAIQAAQNPEQTPYLYFFHTKSGKAIYSKTFEQHKTARQKYL